MNGYHHINLENNFVVTSGDCYGTSQISVDNFGKEYT